MQYRLGEVHLRQQQLRGHFHSLEEEMLAGQEEVISCLDEYQHERAATMTAAEGTMLSLQSQLLTLDQRGESDPILLGSVIWLLKNAIGKVVCEFWVAFEWAIGYANECDLYITDH